MAARIINKKQNGTAMLETALVLPVVLILLMGVVDLGRAISQYLTISRAAYEGVRYVGKLRGNSDSSISRATGSTNPTQNISYTDQDSYDNLMAGSSRIELMLKEQGIKQVKSNINVTKEVSGNMTFMRIQTDVEIPFNAFFPVFRLLKIKTSVTSSDLFQDKVNRR